MAQDREIRFYGIRAAYCDAGRRVNQLLPVPAPVDEYFAAQAAALGRMVEIGRARFIGGAVQPTDEARIMGQRACMTDVRDWAGGDVLYMHMERLTRDMTPEARRILEAVSGQRVRYKKRTITAAPFIDFDAATVRWLIKEQVLSRCRWDRSLVVLASFGRRYIRVLKSRRWDYEAVIAYCLARGEGYRAPLMWNGAPIKKNELAQRFGVTHRTVEEWRRCGHTCDDDIYWREVVV